MFMLNWWSWQTVINNKQYNHWISSVCAPVTLYIENLPITFAMCHKQGNLLIICTCLENMTEVIVSIVTNDVRKWVLQCSCVVSNNILCSANSCRWCKLMNFFLYVKPLKCYWKILKINNIDFAVFFQNAEVLFNGSKYTQYIG